jgi:hypothetical protein
MRKRLKKKLSLSRETLRNLQGDQLRKAAGGGFCTREDMTTCVCTNACNSGTGGTGTGSGGTCPTITIQDMTCCGNC